MGSSDLGIVIPALNEASTIQQVVMRVRDFGIPIVVNDGSTDATEEIAKAAGAVVVTHSVNRGYDTALSSGFSQAKKMGLKFVITLDADGQHDPSLLPKIYKALQQDNVLVTGKRSRTQRIAETLFAVYTGYFWGLHDPLCGLKGYRMSLYDQLGHFDSYGSIGTELALFAVKSGFQFQEIPFVTLERKAGKPRFASSLRANYLVFRAMVHGMLMKGHHQ